MKRHLYFLLVMLATGLVGCNITIKPDPNSVTTNVDSVEVSVNVNVYGDSVAAQPVDLSQCDMVMLDNGKLHFYDTKTATSIPYVAETDSVVNCVFTPDDCLYYCVPAGKGIVLKRVNLTEANPQPELLADWGVEYEKCVTETYGTVSPLEYYAGRRMLGLHHDFSWDGFDFIEQKLYNMDNGQITDWDYETWQETEPVYISDDQEEMGENYQYVSTADEFAEFLHDENGQYWFKDGDPVCLTNKIDFSQYVSDPEYASDREFSYISSAPDNSKVLYMAILEWGDYPHGILAVSSYDGTFQMPLEDTDCTGFNAKWLDDGSLVYVGEEPLSPDDPDYDANWHYRTHCIKRIYPDGHVEIIAHCGDFQVKQSVLH